MSATVEEMINLVSFYVLDRQIGIAEVLAREFLDDCSPSPLKQSGYAILSIAMAYFEMIEQSSQGRESRSNESATFFRDGFRRVYPVTAFTDSEIDLIYSWVRCKMYHCGMVHRGLAKGKVTRMAVHLSRHFSEGFALSAGELHINPGRVVEEIKAHFLLYVETLRDPCCCHERDTFRLYCETLGVGEPIPDYVHSSTTQLTKTTPAPWAHG
jgi:hypothetical protein